MERAQAAHRTVTRHRLLDVGPRDGAVGHPSRRHASLFRVGWAICGDCRSPIPLITNTKLDDVIGLPANPLISVSVHAFRSALDTARLPLSFTLLPLPLSLILLADVITPRHPIKRDRIQHLKHKLVPPEVSAHESFLGARHWAKVKLQVPRFYGFGDRH